ncbi:hypothetical protein [uncultured Flavobacterium sp.]|uniref:hypothetical protein n=1 Tax=uncultured Flavobacterium sp. TaxID=165435 RepID=UPI0030EC8947|tara:strand:+ start:32125 stop:33027 length:903 start_codon:yes stop_codon:yes gene_type:complete
MKIYCKELDKNFESKEEMFKAIAENMTNVLDTKKAQYKEADNYGLSISVKGVTDEVIETLKSISLKAMNPFSKSIDYTKEANLPNIEVTAISNTTNFFDSHFDVHADGIWKKTVSDNKKGFDHLQEHRMGFANIISENAKTTIVKTTFKELGFNYEGTTEALTHTSIIDPNRNLFMYNQYANKWVKNHSVGMRYVTILFCANSEMEDMKEYKDRWDKYYPLIANKDDVDVHGYFWYVKEAKLAEFSAVPKGSNPITPTTNTIFQADKSLDNLEQADETLEEGSLDKSKIEETQKKKVFIN